MTNSEKITSNNALIDEAIAKANALPDAGSGGGGGGGAVETCTVTVTSDAPAQTYVFYTSVDENGQIISTKANQRLGALTVVCNTAIGVYFNILSPIYTGSGFSDYEPSYWDYSRHITLLAPSEANAQAYLNCIDDG